jgi:hypothetical protein
VKLTIKYNKAHILEVFKSTYAFSAVIDPEVEQDQVITEKYLFRDWIATMDLIPKPDIQVSHFDKKFNAQIPTNLFKQLWKSKTSTLGDLAELIEKHAQPIAIPLTRFGGKICETGGILRFLVRKMQAVAPEGLLIRPSTPLSHLFKQQNVTHFGELMAFLPDMVPPPKKVSHWKLQPSVLKTRILAYQILSIVSIAFGVYSYFWGIKFHILWAAVALSVAFIGWKLDKKARRAVHWIFPGTTNLRDLVLRESKKSTPSWTKLLYE